MKKEWREVHLGDICEVSSSKRIYASDYVETGIPFYRSKEIIEAFNGKKISLELFIDVNKYEKIKIKHGVPEVNDILLTSVGTIGVPFIVRNTKPFYFKDGNLIWLKTSKSLASVDPRFIYSFIISDFGRGKLDSVLIGSSQKALTISGLKSLKINLPPLPTQKEIASTLSAYDDLIENNIRRIELLEEQAQLIYEEWFVRMKFPNYENTQIDAETGLPEGWTNTTLAEIAKINANSISSSFDEDIQYIDISSVSTKSIDHTTKYPIKEAPGRAKRIVTHGDIIWSCVRPNRKSYAVIWNPEDNIIASTGFAVISPIDVPTSFLYQALGTEQFIAYLTNRATGAAYPAVKSIDFKEYDISLPPKPLINKFDAQTKSYLDVIWNLNQQNEKLKEARDILLPRLMMGIIEV